MFWVMCVRSKRELIFDETDEREINFWNGDERTDWDNRSDLDERSDWDDRSDSLLCTIELILESDFERGDWIR